MSDALGPREGGGQRHPFPSGSLSRPRLSSSAKSEFFQPSFPGSVLRNEYNDAYRIAWTYPTSSDPNPALPRPGALSLAPGHSVLEDTLLGPGRQAWARPSTHLSVLALRVKPPGGLRLRRVSFFLYFVRFIYERIALGSGKGRRGRVLPPTPGAGAVRDPLSPPASSNPAPARAPPPGSLRRRLAEAGPSPELPAPTPLCCQLSPVYAKASAATPLQGPAPLAAAFVTSLHAAPTLLPSLPGAALSLPVLVSPMPTIEQ